MSVNINCDCTQINHSVAWKIYEGLDGTTYVSFTVYYSQTWVVSV